MQLSIHSQKISTNNGQISNGFGAHLPDLWWNSIASSPSSGHAFLHKAVPQKFLSRFVPRETCNGIFVFIELISLHLVGFVTRNLSFLFTLPGRTPDIVFKPKKQVKSYKSASPAHLPSQSLLIQNLQTFPGCAHTDTMKNQSPWRWLTSVDERWLPALPCQLNCGVQSKLERFLPLPGFLWKSRASATSPRFLLNGFQHWGRKKCMLSKISQEHIRHMKTCFPKSIRPSEIMSSHFSNRSLGLLKHLYNNCWRNTDGLKGEKKK